MLAKFSEIFKKITAYFQHLFGIKPYIPSNLEKKDVDQFAPQGSKTAQKPLALPITSKYENIDWENNPPQYRKRKGVLSFRERQFLHLLIRIVGQNHQILSMVRMADVIYLSNETEDNKYHRNNIQCKHFDYVICGKPKYEPLLVIELDDPKHQYVFRKQVDDFKDKACQEAGLPILRFKVQEKYNENKIAQQIHQLLPTESENN